MSGLAVACLVLAAVAAGWPVPGRRARWRRLVATAPADDRPPARTRRWLQQSLSQVRGRVALAEWPAAGGRVQAGALLAVLVALAAWHGGPVAVLVVGGYGVVAVREFWRHQHQRRRTIRRGELLDLLGAATADLRAGLPAAAALAGVATADPAGRLWRRAESAVQLAERTGAPLAEVIERIEADARATDRARATATAQVAGARATAWLLTALPLAGLALGYLIGADPLSVLLWTPWGAACAVTAVVLQLAGLSWAGRITRPASAGES